MANEIRTAERLLKAAGDASRLRILKCLQVRSCRVCELVQATGMAQPRVSRHLKVLRDAGLVTAGRDTQWVEYCLAEAGNGSSGADVLSIVATWLEHDEQTLSDRGRLATTSRAQCACEPAGG